MLKLWLDSKPVEVGDEVILDLAAGQRTLTFAVSLEKLPAGLRCELDDVEGSQAQVQIVTGN